MLLETFVNGINELAFCVGYAAIVGSVTYGVVAIIKSLVNRNNISK